MLYHALVSSVVHGSVFFVNSACRDSNVVLGL